MNVSIGLRARSGASAFVVGIALAPFAGVAKPALDMSKYDCTRPTDQKTVTGDRLAAEGYQIANKARFGDINLMMTKPNATGLANCFLRPEARN